MDTVENDDFWLSRLREITDILESLGLAHLQARFPHPVSQSVGIWQLVVPYPASRALTRVFCILLQFLPTLNLWLFFSPKLTWRDVQHVIVETSQVTSPLDEGWKINGAGKRYNRKFGFGRLDVSKMVDKVLKWNNVDKQRICHGAAHTTSRFVLKLPWCNF